MPTSGIHDFNTKQQCPFSLTTLPVITFKVLLQKDFKAQGFSKEEQIKDIFINVLSSNVVTPKHRHTQFFNLYAKIKH